MLNLPSNILDSVSPIIHCVRHAQGVHNLSPDNHGILDPSLTELGERQCRELHATFPYQNEIGLVVASPLRRTIYTALLAFDDSVRHGVKVVALPEVQETSDFPCDTGSDPSVLREEFDDLPVDLTLVKDGWNIKQGRWAASRGAIAERAQVARQWLKARPEKEIVLVSHGGFLHYFTEDWTDSNRFPGTGWANTEYRSYTFSDDSNAQASITETSESRERRRGSEKPLGQDERMELKETTHQMGKLA